ncbi:hypothetical protein Pfo_015289 [Paulownia fortunei]|nr:hypothetical protein Pfo_015289 [Paulownia fortunei]
MDSQGTSILQERKQCRLVLFPLPFQGHINPMLQLANILHSRGFSISIIHTRYNCPNPSKYPFFTFHLISDGLPDIEDSTPDPVLIIKLINANCEEPFRKCLDQLFSKDGNHQVKCLVTDANWYFAQSVADNLRLPRIVMRTSSVCSFLAFAALSVLRERGYLSNRDSKMEEPVQELPPLKVKDIPVIEMYNPEDAYQNITNMVEETKKASGIIFNTFKELEEPELAKLHQQFLMPTFVIGPFHKCFSAASSSLMTQDRSSISWLDTQAPKSVLYVSFGMASGLANSMQPFLWVVRPGLVHCSKWLEMLPNGFLEATSKRGHIIKWAPQQEVLSHPAIGGFWTHNGWNSTLESICEGVPMICSPFFGDQLVNSRYVNDVWKIGIRKLLVEREGEEMRQRVKFLKEKIELGLNLGGSSYQSLDGLVDFISSLRICAA